MFVSVELCTCYIINYYYSLSKVANAYPLVVEANKNTLAVVVEVSVAPSCWVEETATYFPVALFCRYPIVGTLSEGEVGTGVGLRVGVRVGFVVGLRVGTGVGLRVGASVGFVVGAGVGLGVGFKVGCGVGLGVGFVVGAGVGWVVGACVTPFKKLKLRLFGLFVVCVLCTCVV